MVAAGKLPTLADKSIPIPEGLRAFQAATLAVPLEKPPARRPASPPPEEDEPDEPFSSLVGSVSLSIALRKAQLAEKTNRAKLLDLEWKTRRGELVPLDEVRADAISTCEVIRAGLLALGPRVALILEEKCANGAAPRAPAIQAVIEDEVNVLLVALYSGRFASLDATTQESLCFDPPGEPT